MIKSAKLLLWVCYSLWIKTNVKLLSCAGNKKQNLKKGIFFLSANTHGMYSNVEFLYRIVYKIPDVWLRGIIFDLLKDHSYTRMVLNIDWGELPRVSQKIAFRRMGIAGHCHHQPDLPASRLVLWEPKHGRKNRGGQRASFKGMLKQDAWAETVEELARCMEDMGDWNIQRWSRLQAT